MLPFIGRIVSKHTTAYTYLPESVLQFPEPEALAMRLRGAGFTNVKYELLFAGVCAVHVGEKTAEPARSDTPGSASEHSEGSRVG